MQLTPEQQQQVLQAKANGDNRVSIQFTPEQRADWAAAVQEELAGKEENIAHFRKLQAAAQQPGFFGDVRRAIVLSKRPMDELAQKIGVALSQFSDFRAGDAELPSASLDRLIEVLGLRLMSPSPTVKSV